MSNFSHFDKGHAQMVDVSNKTSTVRQAIASAKVKMLPTTLAALRAEQLPKGDPFETARIAGILAAKQTATLIPLCHPLPISHVDVKIELKEDGLQLMASVSTQAATGVEMEALTAVSVAALTIYDMCKAVEKGITITDIQLEEKIGGKSGHWQRSDKS